MQKPLHNFEKGCEMANNVPSSVTQHMQIKRVILVNVNTKTSCSSLLFIPEKVNLTEVRISFVSPKTLEMSWK
jgi:hypothetical protein